ncbi:MAG: PP2C family protein-serine/threonine phosphatase [Ilumatobacteraceae bacterium]
MTGDPALDDASVGRAVARLFATADRVPPWDIAPLVEVLRDAVGASSARLFVADYGLRILQQVSMTSGEGETMMIEGTVAGRAFANDEIIASANEAVIWIPLTDGTERIGVIELAFDSGDSVRREVLKPVIAALVLLLVARRRYSDVWHRTRRSEPMSPAAEAQWSLLPPLSCTTANVSVGGILEPAYEIGGDSFDYALNDHRLDFAIVDAVGHGMSAVLMSTTAVGSLRNVRREQGDLTTAYRHTDRLIAAQFGKSHFVTGQIGTVDFSTGDLSWLNAGHVLPMLVRNDTYAGELQCSPSMPMGLGGDVVDVATIALQRGDRILFYTDGITESRSPDGTLFGADRLADFLVRSSLDQVPVAETVRRLAANVVSYVGSGLHDDATLLLIEYRGAGDEA